MQDLSRVVRAYAKSPLIAESYIKPQTCAALCSERRSIPFGRPLHQLHLADHFHLDSNFHLTDRIHLVSQHHMVSHISLTIAEAIGYSHLFLVIDTDTDQRHFHWRWCKVSVPCCRFRAGLAAMREHYHFHWAMNNAKKVHYHFRLVMGIALPW